MTRWYAEKKREAYYRQAKKEGYRARSAYKLQQINNKFHLLKPGSAVADLGCAPGAWTQVLVQIVGDRGTVVGVDLAATAPVEGATLLQGDMTTPETKEAVRKAAGPEGLDAVVSDMSPNISGHYDRDQAESVWLAQHALAFAKDMLKPGGNFLVKVFEGQDFQEFLDEVRGLFARVKMFHPPASRKRSSEVFVVAKGFKAA